MTVAAERPAAGDVAPPPALPNEQRRWYFAEGSTRAPFTLSFALYNPNPRPTVAHILFLLPSGQQIPFDLRLQANSLEILEPSDIMSDAEFSTIETTELPVYVERSMSFGHDGHSAAGARQPAREWNLAEGSSVQPFDTWVLLMNPNAVATTARLRFMREDGSSVDRTEQLPAMGRRSVYVNGLFTVAGFATQVVSDQPIVVERAMYFDRGRGGHDTLATASPGTSWYLAEGSSRTGFDTWLLLQNPGNAPVSANVAFITDTGRVINQPVFVLPRARTSLYVNPLVPDSTFGIHATSDLPVVVERAVYFDDGRAGFASSAVPAAATEWFLPAGSTTGSSTEQLALLNPQAQPANVQVEFRPDEGEPPSARRFSIGGNTRLTMDVNPYVPDANVAMRVIADRPIVVERTTYFARHDGQGATSSTGLTR